MPNYAMYTVRTMLIIALSILTACAAMLPKAPDSWVDEVALHDGRTIDVNRTVHYNLSSNSGTYAIGKSPNQFSLSAKNPDTGKSITWDGQKFSQPVMMDFYNGVPYLVTVEESMFSDMKQYGCPEIPYIFFKYVDNHWVQIPANELPTTLPLANLGYGGTNKVGRYTKEQIANSFTYFESTTSKFVTRHIPTDFASWKSKYKNEYRVGHRGDGCRDTVPSNEDPSHPQSKGQPFMNVDLEVLETKSFEPTWTLSHEEWSAMTWSIERAKTCNALLRQVGDDSDRPELRGWMVFVKDPTGSKKARLTSNAYCDADAIWFTDYSEDKHIIFTKFTETGDFVYRIGFDRLLATGGISQSTFKSSGGYLYFDMWSASQSGEVWNIKKTMKVRLQEPEMRLKQ